MTKEEHIARINQKIIAADEIHTGAVVDELAGILATMDAAAALVAGAAAPPPPPPEDPAE